MIFTTWYAVRAKQYYNYFGLCAYVYMYICISIWFVYSIAVCDN